MVAVIKTGSSIHRILNYNEQKVKEGIAQCIMAANFPKDVEDLSLNNKLNRLLNQAALNENVTRNSMHISLNFHPTENLSHARLGEIADVYMHKIGFGKQPYLVYQHQDAGHPHIHIVTIKVRADGSRIDTQNIGRNQSEKARKEIEQTFGLKRAEDSKKRQVYELKPVNVQRVQYGKSETKRAITNVLDAVLNTYKYSSLPELNAVLQQYNVVADRGNEASRIYQNNGLVYRIIDDSGNKVGVPIKASDFYNKPTLKYLKTKFGLNETAKQPHKVRVKNAVDLALLKYPKHSIQSLAQSLEKEAINTVIRHNDEGIIYGVTYVDHRTKTVFNGSDLGKQYSAKGIQDRCKHIERLQPTQT
nr:relaxase/mobilization nuclease domain-containing protein [Chitinophagaceae bacterium]